MELILKATACVLIGYFIGTINPSFILAKIKGFDIRTRGTGNPGASNAVIVLGKAAGLSCAAFDILKAFLAVRLCNMLFGDFTYAMIISGTCCVLGHIFPVFLKFKGGKGLAAMAGMVLGFDWKLFLILLAIEFVIVIVADFICLIPTTGSVMFTIAVGIQHGFLFSLIFLPVTIIVLARHFENFKNIRYGIEYRIRFLWKREQELQRVQANKDKMTEEQKAYLKVK